MKQSGLSNTEKSIIAECLKHFNKVRYQLYCYVVMDDHVHLIAKPIADSILSKIIHTWKSYTAHKLVKELNRRSPVWQDEYQDRIIRDEDELKQKAEYILTNPKRKWGIDVDYEWAGLAQRDY